MWDMGEGVPVRARARACARASARARRKGMAVLVKEAFCRLIALGVECKR